MFVIFLFKFSNKMKNLKCHAFGTVPKYNRKIAERESLKYHAFGTIPKYNRKITERDKPDILIPQIHFRSLSQA